MSAQPPPGPARRSLGRTGLQVSEVGFGTLGLSGGVRVAGQALGYGPADDATSLAALARAFELGLNFVDTSDAFGLGHGEALVGKALKISPVRIHVASKVGCVRNDPEPPGWDFSPEYIQKACDYSLNRLGITCLDLYQLEFPPLDVLRSTEVWRTLRALKDKGKIAHYGVAVRTVEEGLAALAQCEIETLEVAYNLLERAVEAELLPEAGKRGVGLLVREPLANGLLAAHYRPGHLFPEDDQRRAQYPPPRLEKLLKRVEALRFLSDGTQRTPVQAALKFALVPEMIGVVLPGIRTAAQAEECAAVSLVPDLTREELARLETC